MDTTRNGSLKKTCSNSVQGLAERMIRNSSPVYREVPALRAMDDAGQKRRRILQQLGSEANTTRLNAALHTHRPVKQSLLELNVCATVLGSGRKPQEFKRIICELWLHAFAQRALNLDMGRGDKKLIVPGHVYEARGPQIPCLQ